MKKKVSIITIVIAVALLLVITLTACAKDRKPVSADTFTQKLEALGYTVTEQATDAAIQKNLLAEKDGDYTVRLSIYTSVQNAASHYNVFDAYIQQFAKSRTTASAGNFAYIKVTANDVYYVNYRVENVLLFVEVPKESKTDIDNFLKEIGY